jgi:hypothetical protein
MFSLPSTSPEQLALRRARVCGWLEVTSAIGDGALQRWQQECQRKHQAFALSRPEQHRTSIWLVLPEGCCWNLEQLDLVMSSCAAVTGVLLGENSLRAFVPSGGEAQLFSQLLPAPGPTREPLFIIS